MGGGPPSADVVRSSCILTFPEETMAEPVPVDAWYLFAVGLTFLRRLARDRVGDDMKISLVMQQVSDDDDASESTSERSSSSSSSGDHAKVKRYVAVGSDDILKRALQDTFDHPERVLVLHIISLAKVVGVKSIHVRPEINPNVSPEPVAPMGLVFPTLHVEGAQHATLVPAATPLSMSYSMSKSVFEFRKGSELGGSHETKMAAVGGGGKAHSLSHSADFIEEREYSWRPSAQQAQERQLEQRLPPPPQEPQTLESSTTQKTRAMDHSYLRAAKQVDVDDQVDMSSIPMARVVGHADQSSFEGAPIASDYVMLELQNGAGLTETPGNATGSTYFISSMWHVQAEEMSASMRAARPPPSAVAAAASMPTATRWLRQSDGGDGEEDQRQRREDRAFPAAASLEGSFVMLERDSK